MTLIFKLSSLSLPLKKFEFMDAFALNPVSLSSEWLNASSEGEAASGKIEVFEGTGFTGMLFVSFRGLSDSALYYLFQY